MGYRVASLTSVSAANRQPYFSGGGAAIPNAVVFPENAVPAHISASSGGVTVTAGGTNQNIVLAPSGTGWTAANLILSIDGAAGTWRELYYRTSGSPRWETWVTNIAESGGNAGSDFRLTRYSDAGGSLGAAMSVTRSTGNIGLFGVSSPGYPVDVGGDVNTSGVYRVGGTNTGVATHTYNVRKNGGASDCTIIVTGGIVTGGTC